MSGFRTVVGCAMFVGTLIVPAGATPTASTIAIGAAHGDIIGSAAGRVVPLTTSSFLVSTLGPDNTATTADDETLLISGVGGTPSIVALATPYLTSYSPRTTRVSATRALIPHAGPDATFRTADDGVYLLDKLGTLNTVDSLTTGALWTGDGHTPTSLSTDTAVVCTLGPDNAPDNADDTIALLSDLGGLNTVVQLPAAGLQLLGQFQPERLTDTSFLVTSEGADGSLGTADDVIYLFTDVGGANTRTTLATPNLMTRAPGRAVRLTATRAIVATEGPDSNGGTADDVVLLLDDLGGTNTITPIPVPGVLSTGAGVVVALSETTAVVATGGVAGPGDADDSLAVLTDLGGTNTVTQVTVGGLNHNRACRPVRLTATSVALSTGGADFVMGGADDEVVAVLDVGGANTVVRVAVPGLVEDVQSEIVRLTADAVLVTSGGADNLLNGSGDEVVTLIRGLSGTPIVESAPVGIISNQNFPSLAAQRLGGGRAVLAHPGADGSISSGLDDEISIVDGLPGGGTFATTVLKFGFKANKPEKPEKISLKAALAMDDPTLFGTTDLHVVIGDAEQTIPASELVYTAKKQRFTYKDRKNEKGFVKALVFAAKRGKLTVSGRSSGRAAADSIEASFASEDILFSEVFEGTAGKTGIKYKAPK